ncbi:MAG TPA: HAD-IC family P-type ATPase [Candidatus Limadaptatus stercoravium]|nr:HAD-IC family P-type ATPase [Candidatus Limadaptatus stercoravium]
MTEQDKIPDTGATSAPVFSAEGLSDEEVRERVAAGKVNGEQTVRTKSVAQILRSNILTFFNFVFIVLAVLLAGFVPAGMDGIGNFGFLILIVFNTLVGIVQELRAKRTMDRLSLLSAPKAVVVREGETREIAIEDIVLDDIAELSSGRQVCADGIIVEGSCEVNESLVTGEPDAIVKNVGDRVISGSFVVSGKAKCRVEHVGADNFVMKISSGAKYFKKPTSEIWRSLMLIVKVMSIVIVPVGIALFCSKYFRDTSALNDTVVTTIGSVIGMIPSGLVALASTVFCVSVIRLSRRKTLAQDLYCVETLARVDVLCLDKTGTITEGSMEVNGVEPREGLSEEEFKAVLKDTVAATGDENATALALRNYLSGIPSSRTAENVVPFSSARKWSGARFDGVSYALGAVEFTLGHGEGGIFDTAAAHAEEGYRVLALVSSKGDFIDQKLPDNVTFEGFVYLTDKIRAEAPDTLRFFREQGVDVKIISGDNPSTVRAVAKRAGLEKCDDIIDMSTLSTEEEVWEAAGKYTVFGRVLPDQKLTLVKALKAAGHTVAMTGDGVNDVLALKEADCSVAMASGSDAAKNVSSLVLLDSNFASMPHIVAEGRRSINNLERSAALYIMKTVYNVLLALLFMIVNEPLPFEPRNLTLIGGVTIGMPSIVLALEPNNELVRGRFLTKVLCYAVPGGVIVLLGAAAVMVADRCFIDVSPDQIRTMYCIVTTFVGMIYLFRVALPPTWIHIVLCIVMAGIYVGCYVTEIQIIIDFFGVNNDVTAEMGKAMAAICAVLAVLYAAVSVPTRNLHSKIDTALNSKLKKKVAV